MTSEWRSSAPYRIPGAIATEHEFLAPLDYEDPARGSITVFALELVRPDNANRDLPWLLFLQGGPGGPSPRPLSASEVWLPRALESHRVLLLDQRGTGRSTPMSRHSADGFESPAALAAYIRFLRSDSIVRDAELIRSRLCPGRRWEILAQSYGGWITTTYLSQAPEGLSICYVTGGLPGLRTSAYDLNLRTMARVRDRVEKFYRLYPQDRDIVERIRDTLSGGYRLPTGELLSVDRMRQIGRWLGMEHGYSRLHWLFNTAFVRKGVLSDAFLTGVADPTRYDTTPLHPVLIDFTYPNGSVATDWPADRAIADFPEYSSDAETLLFTGEFSFRWMFNEVDQLRPFAEAMDILHAATDWRQLWQPETLQRNTVPVVAAIYQDDMFVEVEFSLETAQAIPNVHAWVTNEWEHDGVRVSGGAVLSRLFEIATDVDAIDDAQ